MIPRLLVIWLLLLALPALPADAEKFRLKEDANPLSILPAGRGSGSAESGIPFEKSYEQLTAGQQRQLKSSYVEMGDLDEPPYPLGGLRALFKPITAGQQGLIFEGTFRADVEIDAHGDPVAIAVFRSPSKEATDLVARVVMAVRFKPAVCAGKPCKMGFPLLVVFKTQ